MAAAAASPAAADGGDQTHTQVSAEDRAAVRQLYRTMFDSRASNTGAPAITEERLDFLCAEMHPVTLALSALMGACAAL